MKKIFLVIIILFISINIGYTQSVYVENALNFSKNEYGGTARFIGMGGAFGAIGGDFSSIAINPAGLGIYRSSEFVFSPGMSFNTNDAQYIGNSVNESNYALNLNNLGFVASYNLEDSDTRWVYFNFGVGFNRTVDLNNNLRFEGVNNNSLMEVFVNQANVDGYNPNDQTIDPLFLNGPYEYLLFSSGVIDTSGTVYFSDITDQVINDPDNFEIFQRKAIETEGSISEFNFSFSGNYAHRLYLGASVGIYRLRYEQFASHYEFETTNVPIVFTDGFDFREYSKTEGTGFNFKIGAIYKAFDFLRFGVSLHTPTFYSLTQEFNNSAIGYYDTANDFQPATSPVQTYEYELTTPWRYIGSVGFQVGKFALINVDYEYADYSAMKLDDEFNSQEVTVDNDDINSIYDKTHNLRAGAELRYGPLYFRGGGRYSTSPYKNNDNYDEFTIAGGLGYRTDKFFMDLAFSQSQYSYSMQAYEYEFNDAIANIDNKVNNYVLTFGFKF